jgi:1,4-dihydroxy-2-naphthoate phytyltransferase
MAQPSDRQKLWLAALKPPMYSVAVMPILVGSAIAYSQQYPLNWQVLLAFVTGAVLILAWENLCNDVFDAETGVDRHKYHSLVSLTGKGQLILAIANVLLLLGLALIAWICWQEQDMVIGAMVLLCCILGYIYQGPPFRLGYQGWGELLCFLSFGPLGVSAGYYSQAHRFSGTALLASVAVGTVISLVLFCSHFHQVADDLAAGKYSPVVRLGTERSAALIPWVCVGAYGILLIGISLQVFPPATALALVGLPSAIHLCQTIATYHHIPERVSHSKFIALGFQFWFCLGLALGFALL